MTGAPTFIAVFFRLIIAALIMAAPCCVRGADDPGPSGDGVIRGKAGESEIVMTTTSRTAGAVSSLTWGGKEFIDSSDHGRELQSAANFDAGSRFYPETFNPTEAGSMSDGRGETSTSRLLHVVRTADALQTTTQMAFWLKPGQRSAGHAARNTTALSDHLLTKRVTIGYELEGRRLPHVIRYDVTFSMPVGERHGYAQFEVVTGYMPPEFEKFWRYDGGADTLEPLPDGTGEQPWPVVFSTADGGHAMGVYCPPQSRDYGPPAYGRFRFTSQHVNKWNCVYRLRDAKGISPGEYSFRSFVVVGDLPAVKESMSALRDVGREVQP